MIGYSDALRGLAVWSAAFALTSAGFAADTHVVPKVKSFKGPVGIKHDTTKDFPQISETVSTPWKSPNNPSFMTRPKQGGSNSLTAGSATLTTGNDLGPKFPGISFGNSYPADPQIAVSTSHIVQVVNTTIAFFTKAGSKTYQIDIGANGFFSGLNATSFCFDPKVFFDTSTNRFFVVCLEADNSTSHFLIAVSDDANPNGNWFKYRIDNHGVDGSNEFWLDYPGWGFNKDAIVATGNMFPFAAGNSFVQAFVIKKAELLTGGQPVVTAFKDTSTFTIQVAKSTDKTTSLVYGCSLDSTSSLHVYAWRNLTTTPEMVYTTLAVPSFNFIGSPPSKGGVFLDSLSGRLIDAVHQSGSLLTTHTTAAKGNQKSQVTWYDIKPGNWPTSGNPTLAQTGNVAFSTDAWAFLAGINKNSLGDISVMFTRSGSSIVSDVMIASRKQSDPAGSMGAPVQVATSSTTYRLGGRWGDYGAVCIDPTDNATFWGTNMVGNNNGTWTAEIASWKVSTGSGGNGGTKYSPDGVSTLEGTFVSGNLNSVKAFDNSTYDTDAVKKPDGSYATAVQTTFTVGTAKNNVAGIELNYKGYVAQNKAPTCFLFLWNYSTNRWDNIKTYTFSNTNKVYVAKVDVNAGNYVSTTRQVKTMTRILDPIRNNGQAPTTFRAKSDGALVYILPKG